MGRAKQTLFAFLLLPVGLIILLAIPVVSAFGNPDRAWNALVGMDQALNALTGGSEDQTVSGRAYDAQGKGKAWGCVLCRLLDLFDKDHCKKHKDA